MNEDIINLNEQYINNWFELTYSSYLVLPRLILQSMPNAWQKRFIELLEQIPETIKLDDNYSAEYRINYIVNNKFSVDPYKNYRRGTVKYRDKNE